MDVVVVGAGQAGLATSAALRAAGVEHVVLERGEIGETWRRQRWDSFRLNTPNELSALPGGPLPGDEPEAFATAPDFVASLERYAVAQRVPLRTGCEVVRLERSSPRRFLVHTGAGTLAAAHVVCASGSFVAPAIPAVGSLPSGLQSLHAADYRRPDQLAPGAVLVVGGGQTGVALADELLEAGRRVYLATSRVGRIPRRYRGRDTLWWWRTTGYLDEEPGQRAAEQPWLLRQPQVSGFAGGRTVSLQWLAARGATLLGRLRAIEDGRAQLDASLPDNVRFGDEISIRQRAAIDGFVERHGLAAAPPAEDPADRPVGPVDPGPRSLHLARAGVGCVLWCTGLRSALGWLQEIAPAPRPGGGVELAAGVWAVGFPWLTHRGSGVIPGTHRDPAAVAARIARGRRAQPPASDAPSDRARSLR